ncbi:23S rRNA (adenine(1618)-N(6))-methyltransferase RlmF [Psychromonas sp. psych-6C06]|uniref:23S rRNA (adenine(1618)-N(6))-methyltransferase RlmF n=1 Tax=Psychromonas sp. psych-6C06 TaxID=2058089 RepID=UPI000C32E7F5|nr:23S rRNA (adenine(1618)-N(6))-methyltransferase RlmF [Psychromonas sp. psych-6C06]PKF61283.1 23S rRNA (adenine(1618)-N(6))-methyltransferase RlmF [Psychromonas sp. psych-6C06]
MSKTKKGLHPRNLHQGSYDFELLCRASSPLGAFVFTNQYGTRTIDFSDPEAVVALNQALLKQYYGVDFWQLPEGYLCPPIPGRADYIHALADLLSTGGNIPTGKQIKVLDIGVGANCIYPIIGSQSYGWSFVGCDIDAISLKTAGLIASANKNLTPFIKLRLQKDKQSIFKHIITKQDKFALTICNPPFHSSLEKAQAGTARKVKNLNKSKTEQAVTLNFAGQENELCCVGGEIAFLKQMVIESCEFANQVNWFSSLVSKSENVAPIKKHLEGLGAKQIKVVKMAQGQKISRFIAWSFNDFSIT